MKHIAVLFITLFIYANATAESLKIGLLQIEDSVPFYVAEKEGFFKCSKKYFKYKYKNKN
mgnify:CR=1 FL=1